MITKREVIAIKGFANCVLMDENYLIIPIYLGLSHPKVGKLAKKYKGKQYKNRKICKKLMSQIILKLTIQNI